MDKETLSNYGWIVICILVLAVMIALAGPFGNFVADAVKSTTQGLFDTNQSALNAAGVPGLTVQDQEFDMPDDNGGTETPAPVVGSATIDFDCDGVEDVTLTWEELKLSENGTKYGYDASAISDTEISDNAFNCAFLFTSITIPDSVTNIGDNAFSFCECLKNIDLPESLTNIGQDAFRGCSCISNIYIPEGVICISNNAFWGCYDLESITFEGTTAQWNAMSKGSDWNFNVPATEVICSDGTVSLS